MPNPLLARMGITSLAILLGIFMPLILVTVKPADKRLRTYQRMVSTRLHRGFHMHSLPGLRAGLSTGQHKINISSGEDAFV